MHPQPDNDTMPPTTTGLLIEADKGFSSRIEEFGSIRISTDSIHYREIDRVLPLLKGEQRLMWKWVRWPEAGGAVLDVGTGCGLYALLAASRGCEATGIDINARALLCAKENEARSGLAGRVRWIHGRYNLGQVPERSQDLVVLTPPYHPTAPRINGHVALHAEAGPLGMDCFEEFLGIARRHLKPGGRVAFHQMSPGRGGGAALVEVARRVFHPACSIVMFRLLPTTSFLAFLQRVYPWPSFEPWIRKVSEAWPELDLFMGEITLDGTGRLDVAPWREELSVGWAERAILHAQIAEEGLQRAGAVWER